MRSQPKKRAVTTVTVKGDTTISSRKKQLLDGALRYVLRNGLANVSLRPLATELDTSARMLAFYFKSKEGLLKEVFEELQRRLIASFSTVAEKSTPDGRISPIESFWAWATDRKNVPYLRLLYEAQIIAIQNPAEYGSYLTGASKDWQLAALRATSQRLRSEAMATLCIAVFDGLFFEFMSTGDRPRLTKALREFVAMAER